MQNIYNFFSVVFNRENKNFKFEEGDHLPDELTALMLLHLSPKQWVATCSNVCRKWNRIVNTPMLWERVAKQYSIPFSFKAEEQVTAAFKKQIDLSLYLDTPPKTKEEFLDKIKTIYRIMKAGEIVSINYTSDQVPEAFITILIGKNVPFSQTNPDKLRSYFIQGKEGADFGSKVGMSGNHTTPYSGVFDFFLNYKNIAVDANFIMQEIQNQLTPKPNNLFSLFKQF